MHLEIIPNDIIINIHHCYNIIWHYYYILLMKSRLDTWQQFLSLQKQHQMMVLPKKLGAQLNNCQYIIHKQFDKNSRQKYIFKKHKNQLQTQFRQSFKSLSIDQKLDYYIRHMKLVIGCFNKQIAEPLKYFGMFSGVTYSRSYSLKMWNQKILRLDRQNQIIYAQKDNKIKSYKLIDYLLRSSKNTDYHTLVLSAINERPDERSKTIHLGFKQASQYRDWYKQLRQIMDNIQKKNIMKMMSEFPVSVKRITSSQILLNKKGYQFDHIKNTKQIQSQSRNRQQTSMQNKQQSLKYVYKSKTSLNSDHKTDIKAYTTGSHSQHIQQQISLTRQTQIKSTVINKNEIDGIDKPQIIQKQFVSSNLRQVNEDNSYKIYCDYKLQQLPLFDNYQQQPSSSNIRTYSHKSDHQHYKFILNIPNQQLTQSDIVSILANPSLCTQINTEIDECRIQSLNKSQNTVLMYMKLNKFNKLYRCRDFIFVRTMFQLSQQIQTNTIKSVYIVDKSISDNSHPPPTDIVRGDLQMIWKITKLWNKFEIICDICMRNGGYLKPVQDARLTLKFINGFIKITQMNQQTIRNNVTKFKQHIRFSNITLCLLDHNKYQQITIIDTENNENNKKVAQKQQVNEYSQLVKINSTSQQYYQHHQNKQNDELLTQKSAKMGIKMNYQGIIITDHKYITKKYQLQPVNRQLNTNQIQQNSHYYSWKKQWNRIKNGGIFYLNHKRLLNQQADLKNMMNKIGKSILSGKSVIDTCLPVNIFSNKSNLQLLMDCLVYAPVKIEPICKSNVFQRFKQVIGFGVSTSNLYVDFGKPFNPIIGQTYQYFIDGCPGYAQQISHHPPIASIYLKGRGYTISAQIQSKVQLHINSCSAKNDGIYTIQFDDGVKICYQCPYGQINGLTYGKRVYNMMGTSYFWTECKQSLGIEYFIELTYNPKNKLIFTKGQDNKEQDYIQGTIYKVKCQFLKQHKNKKIRSPPSKYIVQKMGKVLGIWNQEISYNNQCLIDFHKQIPAKIQPEMIPLPSDGYWREDIYYKKKMEIQKSQNQKQRLQTIQRKDQQNRRKNMIKEK